MSPTSRDVQTLSERLADNFYAWERRGRGWAVWNYPVVLEPPFRPFFHAMSGDAPGDDARTPGLIERFVHLFRSAGERKQQARLEDEDIDEAEPDWDDEGTIVELQVRPSSDLDVGFELAERMILASAAASGPVSFECVGAKNRIALQFACRAEDQEAVVQVLSAFTPDTLVESAEHLLASAWDASGSESVVVDFGLTREFMLPLETPGSFKVDPLIALVGALDGLAEHEIALFQVLFERTAYPWVESIERAVSDGRGGSFFADAPGLVALARTKVSRPLFACVIRVGVRAATEGRSWDIARRLGCALEQFGSPAGNELMPLENDGYPKDAHIADVLGRRTRRSGMILASNELASIVHIPSSSVRTAAFRLPVRKTKAAPEQLFTGDVALGMNSHRGTTEVVRLGLPIRLRHVHVIGATGSGKSTLLREMMREDIEAGRGLALLDPHGDLADEVLALIPERRSKDVVVFDPADEEAPVGFNVLRARSERERELLGSDLVAVFRRFSTTWGDQMTAVLGNAILALLEHPEGGTLLDLRRLLVDRRFRDEVITRVDDPAVRSFWAHEYQSIRGRPEASILTRLDQFLRPRAVRRVVADRENRLDLTAFVESGGIFVGRLSQGAIGEENAHLLGSLLVAKFHQVALSREGTHEAERRDFFLYLDEFHHFVTPSLVALLSGARKYRVGLVLAHQELRQLRDSNCEAALLTNAATRVCFRLGDEDARRLADGFSAFDARDLQSLSTGEAICRVERADHDFTVQVRVSTHLPRDDAAARSAGIRKNSRERWGTPREAMDRILATAYGGGAPLGAALIEPETKNGSCEAPPENPPVEREQRGQAKTSPRVAKTPPQEPKLRPSQAPSPRTPGRGGANHKYIQSLIKHYGEERGFRVKIEAELTPGGRVDVLLDRNGQTIACEISISSTAEQEIENVRKCFVGGCGRVVVVSPTRKKLREVERLASSALTAADRERVSFCTLEEVLALLDQEAVPPEAREGNVLGYRVKTSFAKLSPEDQARRQEEIARTIIRSLRRMKDDQSGEGSSQGST